jgi:hypothetical protein
MDPIWIPQFDPPKYNIYIYIYVGTAKYIDFPSYLHESLHLRIKLDIITIHIIAIKGVLGNAAS